MQKSTIITISLIFSVLSSFSQYTLTVEFAALRNSNGNIHYELFDAKKNSVNSGSITVNNNKAFVVIDNLKAGQYGLNFIHDENMNKKLDTNLLGIPKEGFGFSNNAQVRFGPPAFEKWLFEVKDNTKISCKAIYF
jgi:uncharacterized protein (DUF2141 family)